MHDLLLICDVFPPVEIIFEVREDKVNDGVVTDVPVHAIAIQGDTFEELREMARDAVRCHFGDGVPRPNAEDHPPRLRP